MYNEDLIRRFAPPSPKGKALGYRNSFFKASPLGKLSAKLTDEVLVAGHEYSPQSFAPSLWAKDWDNGFLGRGGWSVFLKSRKRIFGDFACISALLFLDLAR